MKQDEVIEMARVWLTEFGIQELRRGAEVEIELNELEAFAKLVAAKEREACAKICDNNTEFLNRLKNHSAADETNDCAKEIRARGEA